MESTKKPLNCFQNQIVIDEARVPAKRNFILFVDKRRHGVNFTDGEARLDELRDFGNPKAVNAARLSKMSKMA